MPRPRKALISLADTPYYHVISRCVRRAYLCGHDKQTRQSYEHRRVFIEDRLRILSSLFCVDVCAYAVISNHYHLVLKLNLPNDDSPMSNQEVIKRWLCLFKGPVLISRYLNNEPLSEAELATVNDIIQVWRNRLYDISWFIPKGRK